MGESGSSSHGVNWSVLTFTFWHNPSKSPMLSKQSADKRRFLTKNQAEELLDWLEANGVRASRLLYRAGEGFLVI
jgi:hypothetical protein